MAMRAVEPSRRRSSSVTHMVGYSHTLRSYGAGAETTYSHYQDDFDMSEYSNITLFSNVWLGSLSAVDVFVNWSPDGINWAHDTLASAAYDGVVTLVRAVLHIDASRHSSYSFPVRARYVRFEWVGYGSNSGSYIGITIQPSFFRFSEIIP